VNPSKEEEEKVKACIADVTASRKRAETRRLARAGK
jgi:hypothetical protein